MKSLDYCRQMSKQFTKQSILFESTRKDVSLYLKYCVHLSSISQKFMLPDGGVFYLDPHYKALDDTIELRLPFPVIAVEFERSSEFLTRVSARQGCYQPSKALFFAHEEEDRINITVIGWHDPLSLWTPYPQVAIPRTGYLDRLNETKQEVGIKIWPNPSSKELIGVDIPISDYADEVGCLLSFLNVLQCKNVGTDVIHPGAVKKAMSAGKKGVLPFDSYHILTVDVPSDKSCTNDSSSATGGTHRSPREHVRRGHIRRLSDGRRIWVNSTIVGVKNNGGSVKKDYAIRAGRFVNQTI